MRTSLVRAFALVGVLCCTLTQLSAQTTNPKPPAPAPGATATSAAPTAAPGSTTGTAAANAPTTNSVTATLPTQAQRPSLMIQRGGKELEWRTNYSHSSTNAIFVDGLAVLPVLVVGQIGVQRVRRDSITTSLAARYGLANNLSTEVKVPFRFERDSYAVPDVSPAQERIASGAGLGDIEGAVNYQFPREREDSIRWVLTAGAKSNTGRDPFAVDAKTGVPLGTGFWNAKIGLTGVKISDPAAVYWNFGYTYNFQRNDIPITVTNSQTGEESIVSIDMKPGNTYDIGGGFAYAVNQRLSINTGVSISFNESTVSNDKSVPNSSTTSASLRLGAVWLTDARQPIDLSLSIGLTDDSPDFSLEYRKSFKF